MLIYIFVFQLQVIDIDGRKKIVTQTFSLDGSRLSFGILPRIVLMSDVSRIVSTGIHFIKYKLLHCNFYMYLYFQFQFLFATLFILLILPLCSLRIYHNTYQCKYLVLIFYSNEYFLHIVEIIYASI
jgi:hypothetical protein